MLKFQKLSLVRGLKEWQKSGKDSEGYFDGNGDLRVSWMDKIAGIEAEEVEEFATSSCKADLWFLRAYGYAREIPIRAVDWWYYNFVNFENNEKVQKLIMKQEFMAVQIERSWDEIITCPDCLGQGVIIMEVGPSSIKTYEELCNRCVGTGKLNVSVIKRRKRLLKKYKNT